MISKTFVVSFAVFLVALVVAETLPKNKKISDQVCSPQNVVHTPKGFIPTSCLDYLKKGYTSCGYYQIFVSRRNKFITYCDMGSEVGAAWTLIMSFSFKNKGVNQFMKPLQVNAPVNEMSPNWNLYKMSLSQMTRLKSKSTHWRATCSFPTYGVDYTDYVRANFRDFDIMTFKGDGICKKAEYVNIRGHQCAQCTARWSHYTRGFAPQIDSYFYSGCDLDARQGAVGGGGEDNFGWYHHFNIKFRCSSDGNATTNWWFGGYQ